MLSELIRELIPGQDQPLQRKPIQVLNTFFDSWLALTFIANFDSDEESSVEEEPEEQEKGFIRTQKPRSFDNSLDVQGPLTDSNDITTKFEYMICYFS